MSLKILRKGDKDERQKYDILNTQTLSGFHLRLKINLLTRYPTIQPLSRNVQSLNSKRPPKVSAVSIETAATNE